MVVHGRETQFPALVPQGKALFGSDGGPTDRRRIYQLTAEIDVGRSLLMKAVRRHSLACYIGYRGTGRTRRRNIRAKEGPQSTF
jgi:hypothetical protein